MIFNILRASFLLLLTLVACLPTFAGTPPSVRSSQFFHAIPETRNLLTVKLVPGEPLTKYNNELSNLNAVILDQFNGLHIVRFPSEAALDNALPILEMFPAVERAGPTVLSPKGMYLTDRLFIKFKGQVEHDIATNSDPPQGSILHNAGYIKIRAVPYSEHGYVFHAPQASYSIYDIAESLLTSDLAHVAVPDTVTPLRNACDGSTCYTEDYLDYLNLIDHCGATSKTIFTWQRPTIALFDQALHDGKLASGSFISSDLGCEALNVIGMVDFSKDIPPTCLFNPESSTPDWCSTCEELIDSLNESTVEPHGIKMAFTAGSKSIDGLMGVAPGVQLIGARRSDDLTRCQIGDAFWWLSGGDPEVADYPDPPTNEQRADVLNLSLTADFGDYATCTSISSPYASVLCVAVGTEGYQPVQDALSALNEGGDPLREGGVLVVAAMGLPDAGANNDLAKDEHTLTLGSVNTDGEPFYSNDDSKTVHHFDTYLDVVAPLGNESEDTVLCESCWEKYGKSKQELTTYNSSAAAAAVSGVGSLMFRVNSDLTASQARCILKETATQPGEWWDIDLASWGKESYSCAFDSDGHSECLGYGLVNACQAVQESINCRKCWMIGLDGTIVQVNCSVLPISAWLGVDGPCICPDEDTTFILFRSEPARVKYASKMCHYFPHLAVCNFYRFPVFPFDFMKY